MRTKKSKYYKLKTSVLVDPVDECLLSDGFWIEKNRNALYVRTRTKGTGRVALLHRTVLQRKLGRVLLRSELTDHKDRNGLNNTRENLRVCTHSQNAANGNIYHSKSGYRGVCRHRKKFRASIERFGKNIIIGHFKTARDAAVAYDRVATMFHGEFAITNFGHHLKIGT